MKRDINVLVVEDSSQARGLLERAFRRTDVRFRGADSLREALHEAARERPDLMILDVYLPDGNGLESMSRLRKAAGGRPIPVLAISGMDPKRLQAWAQAAGCWDSLAKPFTIYDLAGRVSRCLSGVAWPDTP